MNALDFQWNATLWQNTLFVTNWLSHHTVEEEWRQKEKEEGRKEKEKFLSSWQREVKSRVGFCAIDGRHLKRFAY